MPDFDNSFLSQEDHPSVHEDALVFSINSQTIGWRASGLALKRASDKGMEAGQLLADLQMLFSADIDEEDLEGLDEEEIEAKLEEELEMQAGIADFIGVVAKLVWLGTLHFEPEAKQEAVLGLLDTSNVDEAPVEDMLSKVFPAIDDEVDDMGKGQKEKKTKSPR